MTDSIRINVDHQEISFSHKLIDQASAGQLLQQFVTIGSSLEGVELKDLDLSLHKEVKVENAKLQDYLEAGGKLFDLIVWFAMGKPSEVRPTAVTSLKNVAVPSVSEVASAVFFCYFYLLTRAKYPDHGAISKRDSKGKAASSDAAAEDQPVPKFLTSVMGLKKTQQEYVEMIFGFEPNKFGKKWIRYIQFEGFGEEAINRFGLGVAGYRAFTPFKLLTPKEDIPANLKAACAYARKVAQSPASWDYHPVTRDANILTERGNLNKNLGNLMLEAFDRKDLDMLKDTKALYAIPKHDPAHINYRSWSADVEFNGDNLIFPKTK